MTNFSTNNDLRIDLYPAGDIHGEKFVAKYVEYRPLFDKSKVNRDNFIKLRKELIALGCNQDEVVEVARKLSMNVLGIEVEDEYNLYIMSQTFDEISKIIKEGYNDKPEQDLNSEQYSHIGLFSAIYGFELEYLASREITQGIVDIGCGDGLFLQLLAEGGCQARGYEIEIKRTCHAVKIDRIVDIEDIKEPGNVLILNHVLEHISESPSSFIGRTLDHFEKMLNDRLQAVIISLPFHLSLHAHQASDHRWFCWDGEISDQLRETFESGGLQLFAPTLEFSRIAANKGYKLRVYKNIGVYVFE